MKLHKREQKVNIARTKIRIALDDLQKNHDVSDEYMLDYLSVYGSHLSKRMRDRATPALLIAGGTSALLFKTLDELQKKHGLTDIEMFQALNEWQASCLKYMLRYERHGNYNDAAGLAYS